jgi:hypothetical protein
LYAAEKMEENATALCVFYSTVYIAQGIADNLLVFAFLFSRDKDKSGSLKLMRMLLNL